MSTPEVRLPVDTFVSSAQITARIWRYGKGYDRFVDCDMVFDTGFQTDFPP